MPIPKRMSPTNRVQTIKSNVLNRIAPIGFEEGEGIKLLLYGRSGCLSGDTFIKYTIKDPTSGRSQNAKGGTLELLYRRFHNLPRRGKGYYQRKQTVGSNFFVQSVTDDGRVTLNLITDVINSGVRRVFEVVTKSGKRIKATANHEFMTEVGYQPVAKLRVGSKVMVSPGKRMKSSDQKRRIHRPEVLVKNHPAGRLKVIEGYEFFRVPRAHFMLEAHQNGMSPEEYREFLNKANPSDVVGMWSVPRGAEVHHIDENPVNDVVENLALVESGSKHQTLYHPDGTKRRGMEIHVVTEEVVSITPLGTEQVYDISVADPFRNFLAEGFAVHNSGKTTTWATFPKPILSVICSGGKRPGELRSINTKEYRETIRTVTPENTEELKELLDHLSGGGADEFNTVVLDHASGLQDMTLKEILGLDELPAQKSWGLASQQDYGQCTMQCKNMLRKLLNLRGHVVIVAQERSSGEEATDADSIAPSVGAAVFPKLAEWLNPAVDYIGETFIRRMNVLKRVEFAGKVRNQKVVVPGKVEYCLRTAPDPVYTTKFRVPKGSYLPEVLVDPTFEKIDAIIRGEYQD